MFLPRWMPGWQSDAVDFLAGNILLGYSSGGARLAVLHSKKTRSGRQVVDTAERHRRVKAEAAIYVNQTLGPGLEIWRPPPSFSSDCCNRDTGAPRPIAWARYILFAFANTVLPRPRARAPIASAFFSALRGAIPQKNIRCGIVIAVRCRSRQTERGVRGRNEPTSWKL